MRVHVLRCVCVEAEAATEAIAVAIYKIVTYQVSLI